MKCSFCPGVARLQVSRWDSSLPLLSGRYSSQAKPTTKLYTRPSWITIWCAPIFFFFVFKFYLCWYWFPLFSTCRSGLSSWTEQFAKVAKKKSTAIEKRNINISHGEQRRFGRSSTRKESFVPCNKRSYYILDCTIEFLLLTSSSLPKKQNKILLLSWCPSYLCIHEIQPVPCFLDHFSGSWVPAAKEVDRWEWCQGWWLLPCNQWNS